MKRDLASDFRLLTSFLRLRPDFIIPGEAKCGTTSLYRYLTEHPNVVPAQVKEPRSFLDYGASPLLCRRHYPLVTSRWVASLSGRSLLTGEATAEYFSSPSVPAAAARSLPGIKIIVLLRNPVARALSDYRMLRRSGHLQEPFETIVRRSMAWLGDDGLAPLTEASSRLEHGPVRIVQRGLYLKPLRLWREHFPDLLTIRSEDLFADPEEVTNRVYRYLGLPSYTPSDLRAYRSSGRGELPSPGLLSDMREFYRPHNEKLYRFLDRDLEWEAETEGIIEQSRAEAAGA